MIIEFLRHQCGQSDAISAEHEQCAKHTLNTQKHNVVIGLLSNRQSGKNKVDTKGGTMRLGTFSMQLRAGSILHDLYKATTITERHRHRYEVCPHVVPIIEASGMNVVAHRDGVVEAVEVTNHPFFVGCQYHPEYGSSPFAPHPLFVGFLRAVSL